MIWGDGMHDDTREIQEQLDSGARLVALDMPSDCYLISKPLKVHSFQELRLPETAVVRLMPNSNCLMLTNADPKEGNRNIAVSGGIWDFNNKKQVPNPEALRIPETPADYTGNCMIYRNVQNLKLRHMTMKDPASYAITLDRVRDFTVEDIHFDFNDGNPWPGNMDGVHLNGNCHFGCLRNLKGACYDDLVALNADEGSHGPITNIDIDGIYAEDCHSAVRLLSCNCRVENVHIHNVFGTFYQYCIGVSKNEPGQASAYYDALVFDNIFASKAERHSIYQKDGTYVYPVIWIEQDLTVKSLAIENLYRKEEVTAVATILVGENTVVKNLSLRNISTENHVGAPMALLENLGCVEKIYHENLRTDGDAIFAGNPVSTGA